jgi:hypothetical protein
MLSPEAGWRHTVNAFLGTGLKERSSATRMTFRVTLAFEISPWASPEGCWGKIPDVGSRESANAHQRGVFLKVEVESYRIFILRGALDYAHHRDPAQAAVAWAFAGSSNENPPKF